MTHTSASNRGWSPRLALTVLLVVLATPATAQETDDHPNGLPTAGYDRGFFVQSGDGEFLLRTQARLQLRYSYESIDVGDGEDRLFESAFAVPRARLKLSGHVYADWDFTFQADFGGGFVTLKDYFIDAPLGGEVHLRLGQFKRPFSRQQLASSANLALVDRSITNGAFGAGRDLGLMLHNGAPRNGLEWAVGFFNGTGDRSRFAGSATFEASTGTGEVTGGFANVPPQFHPMVVGRIAYNVGDEDRGIRAYHEADLEGGPLRAAVGLSVIGDFDVDGGDDTNARAELDYVVKVDGFSHSAAVYATVADGEDGATGISVMGFHAQLAYVIAQRVQPALRFALVSPDGDDNDLQELTLGANVFFEGHAIKWSTDVGLLTAENPGGSTSDVVFRSQLQFAF